MNAILLSPAAPSAALPVADPSSSTLPKLPTLHSLLDANLAFPPEYQDGLSNHLPMALQALDALGASPAQLQAFFDAYARRFHGRSARARAAAAPPAETFAAPPADWRTLLGDIGAHPQLQAHFVRALAREGQSAVLAQALPVLWPGLAAAAFHGMIRVAHAVEAGHPGELAAGLAYWAARWQTLPAPDHPVPPLAFEAWTARLAEAGRSWRSEAPLISLRMAEAAASPAYQALAAGMAPAPLAGTLAGLARLAAQAYAATGNFTLLHMVTGLRAARLLLPWVADAAAAPGAGDAAGAVLLRAATAAWLAARAGTIDLGIPGADAAPPPSWDQIVAGARDAKDDHRIKLVHACRAEAAFYGEDLLYRRAAATATA